MLLADLGADVVKVEPPEGDATRGWGPPWVGDEAAGTRTAAYFLAGQPQQALDPPRPQEPTPGREVLRRLLRSADVLIENFRVGGFARLGFDDAALRGAQPAASSTSRSRGFGPDGPDADKPGYDFVAQAVGGLMSITGPADAEGGRPGEGRRRDQRRRQRAVRGGRVLAGAARPRARRGPDRAAGGQRIDVSLLGVTLAVLVNQAQNAFVTGRAPGRLGNAHPNIVPYETFVTADGELALAVASERQWPRLCEAGRRCPALADGPRGSRPTATG